eukprot:2605260-Prymnesium_polylepis.1
MLDLAQLDALPAQLHLRAYKCRTRCAGRGRRGRRYGRRGVAHLKVDPSAKLKLAIRVPPHTVTGAVHDAAAGRVGVGPRVGHKLLVRQLRPVE